MTQGRWLAFRILYKLAVLCGETAAYLARLHGNLRSSDGARPPIMWLTTVVFGAWVPVRLLFLVFARCCQAVAPKAREKRSRKAAVQGRVVVAPVADKKALRRSSP